MVGLFFTMKISLADDTPSYVSEVKWQLDMTTKLIIAHWANSADNKLIFFFLIFKTGFVISGKLSPMDEENLHEM